MVRVYSILVFTLVVSLSAVALSAPAVLFHAGNHQVLVEDISARTVPQAAWDQFIFGKTNFDLPDFRKGLYGASRLADINLYLAYELLAGHRPWVMSILVSPECRSENSVFSSTYEIFPVLSAKQNRFSAWYWRNEIAREPGADQCLQAGSDRSYWDDQALYDLHALSSSEIERLQVCNSILERFIKSEKIRMLYDPVNDDSWYLRDRDCIEQIRGTVDENFARFLHNGFGDSRDPVSQNWYGNLGDPGSTYSGHTVFVLTVLSEVHAALGVHELAALKVVSDDLDDAFGMASHAETLRLDHNADDPKIVSLAVKSMSRAIREGRLRPWQADLVPMLADVVVKLGESCHGHHGVPAQYEDGCLKASSAESARLIEFLTK